MDTAIHNPDGNTSGCEIRVFFLFPSPPYKKVSLEKRELWVTQMQVSNPMSCNVLCNALGFYWVMHLQQWSVVGVLVVAHIGPLACPCRAESHYAEVKEERSGEV